MDSMERVDVAIVGAGPAGATAARLLAERGARVVLLEARRIPRHKLCGGGLSPKALPYLAGNAAETIDRRIEHVELAGSRLGPVRLHLPGARVAMVERAPFDAALVHAAIAEGAEFRDGWPVLEIALEPEGARLNGVRGSLWAHVVIGADGDPSRIAHRLGLTEPRRRSLALEVDLPFATHRRTDELQLRFGVPGGYAWYFPKGDHANVGILTWRPEGRSGLRDGLRRYARSLGMKLDGRAVKGHWIPQGLRRGPAIRGRVLLVGDAAATGDPFFGEGISYAMASAVLAANAVEAWSAGRAPLAAYDRALRRAFWPAMRRLTVAAEMADRAPTLAYAALRWSGWARGQAVDRVSGTRAPFRLPGMGNREDGAGVVGPAKTPTG